MRVGVGLGLRELALSQLVTTIDGRARCDSVDLNVAPRRDLRATPGAARELRRRRDCGTVAVSVTDGFDRLMRLLYGAGRHFIADPQSKRKRLRAPFAHVAPANAL